MSEREAATVASLVLKQLLQSPELENVFAAASAKAVRQVLLGGDDANVNLAVLLSGVKEAAVGAKRSADDTTGIVTALRRDGVGTSETHSSGGPASLKWCVSA